MYYKNHVERMRIDVYDLEKTDVILGIPQLQAYNPKINWKIGEVKIMRCLPLCSRTEQKKEGKKVKRKRVATLKEEKIIRQAVDNKKDQRKEEKVEIDPRKIEEMVSKRFLKQRKVFEEIKSEITPTGKVWDFVIDLKKTFK